MSDNDYGIVRAALGAGRENGKTDIILSQETGLSCRRVRKIIEHLRLDGDREEVIVNFQDGRGYYKTDDPREIYRWCKQELGRAFSTIRRCRHARKLCKGKGYKV